MRITIHATIENAGAASAPQVVQIGEVTRDAGVDPASGLGLFVREANALLRQLQGVVLNEQADEFIRVAAGCLACGRRLGIKDTKSFGLSDGLRQGSPAQPALLLTMRRVRLSLRRRRHRVPSSPRAEGPKPSAVDMVPVPVRQRDVVSAREDLS